ncbi:MAG: hypothetical protein ACI9S8_002511 [Chlamydiales bacterium]
MKRGKLSRDEKQEGLNCYSLKEKKQVYTSAVEIKGSDVDLYIIKKSLETAAKVFYG